MWTRVALPGGDGVALRDVAACDGQWYAVGGKGGAPAAWTAGGSVAFEPLAGSFYGPREQISSVACAGRRVAMVGAVPGGAHGNPRVSTWRLDGGRMRENAAPFETYGGDEAVDVGRVEAGRAGFAIAGNRTSGAAAWFSSDGIAYRLTEESDESGTPGGVGAGKGKPGGRTIARDVVALPDGRWLVVGGRATEGSADQEAAAWSGPSWQGADPPVAGGYNELQRVVRQGDDVVAAGMRGTRFGVWRWRNGTWTAEGTYGGDPGGVRSLAVCGKHVVIVGGGLWVDGRKQETPGTPVAAAGNGNTLLMVTADGLWRATLS
jgi:hypothetical protein